MNYKKVNQELRQKFGAGKVELRRAKGNLWTYTLWFESDDPAPDVIEKAKKIVDKYSPTYWFDELKKIVEE